jgi:hypothetical protein
MAGVLEPSNQGAEKNDAKVTFNEQTNFVPKGTIVIVSAVKAPMVQLLTST